MSEDDADTDDVATIQATFLNEPDPVPVSFTYNHLGQRVSKTVGTTTTYFIYDEQGNLISELDTNGNTLTDYIYMGGQRIAIVEGNGSTEDLYFTMNDHLGQTYALTNNDGTNSTIVYERADMPFGEMFAQYKLTSDYTEDENTRFPGQYYDKETGYYQNWHRDYDPMLGRYITSDPIGVLRDYKHDPELMLAIVAGVVDPPQGDGLNHPYAYVDQNPVNLIDPDGLAKWWKWFKPRPPDDTCANTQCTLTQCSVCCQGLKPRTTQCLIACQDQFINGPPNNCKEKDCKDKNSDGGDK